MFLKKLQRVPGISQPPVGRLPEPSVNQILPMLNPQNLPPYLQPNIKHQKGQENQQNLSSLTMALPAGLVVLNSIRNDNQRSKFAIEKRFEPLQRNQVTPKLAFIASPKNQAVKGHRDLLNQDLSLNMSGLSSQTKSKLVLGRILPEQKILLESDVQLPGGDLTNSQARALQKHSFRIRSKSEQPDYERTIDERGMGAWGASNLLGAPILMAPPRLPQKAPPQPEQTNRQLLVIKKSNPEKQPPLNRLQAPTGGMKVVGTRHESQQPQQRLILGKRPAPGLGTISLEAVWEHEKAYREFLENSIKFWETYDTNTPDCPEPVHYAVVWFYFKMVRVLQLKTASNTLRIIYPVTAVEEKLLEHARKAFILKAKDLNLDPQQKEIATLQVQYIESLTKLTDKIRRDFSASEQKSQVVSLINSLHQLSMISIERINNYVRSCMFSMVKIIEAESKTSRPNEVLVQRMKDLVVRHFFLLTLEETQPLSWSKSSPLSKTSYQKFDFGQLAAMQNNPSVFVQQYDDVIREMQVLGTITIRPE